jgi:acylglycerol lipase
MSGTDAGLVELARSGRELRYPGGPPAKEVAERMLEVPTRLLLDARGRNPALAALDLDGGLARLRHEWVDQDGALHHLEVQEIERGAPTVVIVHGLGDHARRLTPLATGLWEAGYNALSLDRRGHGISEGRRGDATLEQDLALLERAVGLARERFAGPVLLLGDSLGGIMIWYLLTREPDIDAAVCHDISHPDVRHERAMVVKAPLTRIVGRLAPGLGIPVRQIADYDQVALDPVTKAYFDDEVDKLFNFTISARSAASYLAFRPRIPWERVTLPVLVIAGAEDRMVTPGFTERCLERAKPPQTTYLKVPGAGHQLFLDHLGEALPPVLDWARETLAASSPAAAG